MKKLEQENQQLQRENASLKKELAEASSRAERVKAALARFVTDVEDVLPDKKRKLQSAEVEPREAPAKRAAAQAATQQPFVPGARAARAALIMELQRMLSSEDPKVMDYCIAELVSFVNGTESWTSVLKGKVWVEVLIELVIEEGDACKIIVLYAYVRHGVGKTSLTASAARSEVDKMAAVLPHLRLEKDFRKWDAANPAGAQTRPSAKKLELFQQVCGFKWSPEAIREAISW